MVGFEEVKINRPDTGIIYISSDGIQFRNKFDYDAHERILISLRRQWYMKRFSLYWEIMYFLFKKEPKKPYKF